MVQLTQHAYNRIKERAGTKGKCAICRADTAFNRGKDISYFTKETRKYLQNVLTYSPSKADTLKVLGTEIYLFVNGICITTFPFPSKVWQREIQRRKHI